MRSNTRYDVTIGLTESDRAGDYYPSCDGWRPDAKQQTVPFAMNIVGEVTDEALCEAVFIATNHPEPTDLTGLARKVYVATLMDRLRSVSVGDTVTVNGRRYEAKRIGWARVTDEVAPAGDKYTQGLVRDIFTRYQITEASIATLPTIIADLAYLIERVSTETTEMALANLTDPACPASTVRG